MSPALIRKLRVGSQVIVRGFGRCRIDRLELFQRGRWALNFALVMPVSQGAKADGFRVWVHTPRTLVRRVLRKRKAVRS